MGVIVRGFIAFRTLSSIVCTYTSPVVLEQSPGGFTTALLDLSSKETFKISCCFPKGNKPLFLLET
jgi:hypothetical protein